jgi:hypothetical protein
MLQSYIKQKREIYADKSKVKKDNNNNTIETKLF